MDPSALLNKHREQLNKLVGTLEIADQNQLMDRWDADADRHNAFKAATFGVLRTPEASDYASCKPLRSFVKKLKAVRVQRLPRYDGPDAIEYLGSHCLQNAHLYAGNHPESKFELVFGFRLWMSDGATPTLCRGEGHVWLQKLDTSDAGDGDGKQAKKRTTWIDPTPPPDYDDTHVFLVESKDYLKEGEKQLLRELREPILKGQHFVPLKMPSIENCSTRALAGCSTVDPIFHSTPFMPAHQVSDLHMLTRAEFPAFPSSKQARLRQKFARKKEKEFWAWRKTVMKQIY